MCCVLGCKFQAEAPNMNTAQSFKLATLTLAGLACAGTATQAAAFSLPTTGFVQYGDAQSYALPLLAYFYDQANGGGVGPGNPFYVASSPGAIKDDIVIGTGASGSGVTTNVAGIDDAY